MKPLSEDTTRPGDSPAARSDTSLPRIFLRGEVISGRFEIRELLGQGGMGQVFEAYDRELETRVALKVVRPDRMDYDDLAQRFKVEVEIARRVTHPHVCRVFDLFAVQPNDSAWGENGQPLMLLTMELIDGETLSNHVERTGGLSITEVSPWIVQMASALDAAHRAGVAHRDFKSSNIVLREGKEGTEAVVTDFGLARSTGSGEGDSGFEGTLAYAAPEVRAGADGNVRSDIYSFGAVVHELLTGQRYAPSSPSSVAMQSLPSNLRRALRRCLAPDPQARFSSAGEAAAALTQRKSRRRATLVTLGTAAVVGGIILAGALSTEARREAELSAAESLRWQRARQIYREEQQRSGGDLGLGLRQVEALADAGDTKAALVEIDQLRSVGDSLPVRVSLDIAEARIAERISDFDRQLRAARRVTQSSNPARDARISLDQARAGILEASALHRLGRVDEAATIASEALTTLAAHGDEWNRAQAALNLDLDFLEEYELMTVPEALRIFQNLGDTEGEARLKIANARRVVGSHPRPSELMEEVDDALSLARSIPSLRGEAEALNVKALLTWTQGDEAAAIRTFREALRAAELSGDPSLIAGYSMNLALMLQHYGRSAEIDQRLAQAVAIFRRLGSRRELSLALANTSRNYRYQKLYPEAEQYAREALAEARLSGDRALVHQSLELMTLVLLADKRYPEARRSTLEALDIAATASEIEWDRLRLARIDWRAGDPAGAVEPLSEIADRNPLSALDPSLAISCRLDLTRVLEELGRIDDAASILLEVIPTTLNSGSKGMRRSTANLAARLHRALGPTSQFPEIFEREFLRAEQDGRFDDLALAAIEQASFLRKLELEKEACRSLARGIEKSSERVEPVLLERLESSHQQCSPQLEELG